MDDTFTHETRTRPKVKLLRAVVGAGKTKAFIDYSGVTHRRRQSELKQPGQLVVFSPTHRLNDQIAHRWETDTGLMAATIMGRTSKDPRHVDPSKADPDWCAFLDLLGLATYYGFPHKQTACIIRVPGGTDIECARFQGENICGYQAQFELARNADLVLMPHASLAHQQDEIGIPYRVLIDEDFVETLIFTLPPPKSEFRFEVDDLLTDIGPIETDLDFFRHELHLLLKRQIAASEIGGVELKHFDDCVVVTLDANKCGSAQYLERQRAPAIEGLRPGLSGSDLENFKTRNATKLQHFMRAMFMVKVWEALQHQLKYNIEVSGRVFLYADRSSGRICIGVRGVRQIVQQWRAPEIFVASATMPPVEIIRSVLPDYDFDEGQVDHQNVALPEHVKFVQVIGAPVAQSKTKFVVPKTPTPKSEKERKRIKGHQTAMRHFVMERALTHNVGPNADPTKPAALIGVQQHLENAWSKQQAWWPDEFSIQHFNAVAGLNQFDEVKLMVSVGLTAVSPVDVENDYAAITGSEPARVKESWYPRAKGLITLRDGGSKVIQCYTHPDPGVEGWRKHKHLAPVIQMIGRTRLYTRATAAVIYVLINADLGIRPDALLDWHRDKLRPLAIIEPMFVDGVVVLTPEWLCTRWPTLFSTRTAGRELALVRKPEGEDAVRAERVRAILAGWRPFTVQKAGRRQQRRDGYYNPARFGRMGGLRSTLETVFGPGLKLAEGNSISPSN